MDPGIKTLLDLHDQIIDQGNGYWLKIEAWQVDPTPVVPHGIRYSLTLHEPYGKRILGYDNAHAIKLPKKFKYAGRIRVYDHKHRHKSDKGVPYEFQDAHQLLTDFFADVDRLLQKVKLKFHRFTGIGRACRGIFQWVCVCSCKFRENLRTPAIAYPTFLKTVKLQVKK